jgi:hypothetical protein
MENSWIQNPNGEHMEW